MAKERARLKEAEEKKEKLKEEIRAADSQIKESQEADTKSYSKFDEKMKGMVLKKRRQLDDIKGITKEDLIDSDDDPIVKGDGKKTIRGLVQKTKETGSKPEESESESSDEDMLTEQQK